MALSGLTSWEVRTTGDDTNGGGFVFGSSGTDWSKQNTAQYSVTDAVTNGTTTITSATANFGTDVVGNILYIAGGTGAITAGWYQITSRTNATTIVVDRSTGLTTGTGATLKIGGALATPGNAASIAVSGNKIWIQTGTYTYTTTTAGAGGPVNVSGKTYLEIEGYAVTRGDLGTPPTLKAGVGLTNFVLVEFGGSSGNSRCAINIKVDGSSNTGTTGFATAQNLCIKCVAINCTTAGYNNVGCCNCYANNCGTGFLGITFGEYCFAKSCTTGFGLGSNCFLFGCIASGGTTSFLINGTGFQGSLCMNCIAYAPSGVGFSDTIGQRHFILINCVAISCTWGANFFSRAVIRKFAHYNCSSGAINNGTSSFYYQTMGDATIALTGNPFVDPANDNFALNNTVGAGRSLKSIGMESSIAQGATASYMDIGAAQIQRSERSRTF